MRWRELARNLVDAYHRVMGEPVDFWPAFEDEVRKAVTADEPPAGDERIAAFKRHRAQHPADAPSEQTRPVRVRSAGLQRNVSYVAKVTAQEVPAAPAAAAKLGASASR